jgi:TolB-like protein
MIGRTISHYKILEKLGEGGMGVVYKAEDLKLTRIVALKFLPPQMAATEEDEARFLREARAISALNHPNIATIHDVDEADGQRFLVLEYIPGGSLKSRLNQLKVEDREFPISQVIACGIQAAEALAHAHRHQIIHRDVKTDNLMLTEDGTVKLTDFGLAKPRGSTRLTKTGTTAGTAPYMSPEQLRGEEIDERSDIFSVGVVLYELATSRLPFSGDFEAALSYSILNEEPAPVSSLRKNAPPPLEQVIKRCLEKEKAKRYQTAVEVANALREIQPGEPAAVSVKKRRRKVAVGIGVGVIGVAAILLSYLLFWPAKPGGTSGKSVAVLPFVNMSSDKEDEYLSDGLTEELSTALAKVNGLFVPARTSCFAFKGKTGDIRKIGNDLNVTTVLEGSVARAKDRLRITAQLIDVPSGGHLWSDTYDREAGDILEIRSDIARQVVAALKIQLGVEEAHSISRKGTENAEAQDLCMRGRFHYNQYTCDGLRQALQYYRLAIEKDPGYAAPYVGISLAYDALSDACLPPKDALPLAKAAALKALDLDSLSGEAHGALGIALTFYEWKFEEGWRELQRSLELNPNSADILVYICQCAVARNEMSEALEQADRAIALDPLSPVPSWMKEILLYRSRRYDDVIKQHQRTARLDSNFFYGDCVIGAAYRQKGMLRQAVAEYQRFAASGPLYGLAITYARMGRMDDARKTALALERESTKRYIAPDALAMIYANLNEKEKAFQWLDKAFEAHSSVLVGLRWFPEYDPIRSDPRFSALLKKFERGE